MTASQRHVRSIAPGLGAPARHTLYRAGQVPASFAEPQERITQSDGTMVSPLHFLGRLVRFTSTGPLAKATYHGRPAQTPPAGVCDSAGVLPLPLPDQWDGMTRLVARRRQSVALVALGGVWSRSRHSLSLSQVPQAPCSNEQRWHDQVHSMQNSSHNTIIEAPKLQIPDEAYCPVHP